MVGTRKRWPMTTENVNVGHSAGTQNWSLDRANQCSFGFSAHPHLGPRICIGLHAESPTWNKPIAEKILSAQFYFRSIFWCQLKLRKPDIWKQYYVMCASSMKLEKEVIIRLIFISALHHHHTLLISVPTLNTGESILHVLHSVTWQYAYQSHIFCDLLYTNIDFRLTVCQS